MSCTARHKSINKYLKLHFQGIQKVKFISLTSVFPFTQYTVFTQISTQPGISAQFLKAVKVNKRPASPTQTWINVHPS